MATSSPLCRLRRDLLDAAVSMNRVIPIGEGMHPVPCRCQRGKALAWKARGVLQGAKQGAIFFGAMRKTEKKTPPQMYASAVLWDLMKSASKATDSG